MNKIQAFEFLCQGWNPWPCLETMDLPGGAGIGALARTRVKEARLQRTKQKDTWTRRCIWIIPRKSETLLRNPLGPRHPPHDHLLCPVWPASSGLVLLPQTGGCQRARHWPPLSVCGSPPSMAPSSARSLLSQPCCSHSLRGEGPQCMGLGRGLRMDGGT